MIKSLTLATTPGNHTVYDSRVGFIKVLLVDLEGTSYDVIRSAGLGFISASRRQVIYEVLRGFRFSTDVRFVPGDTVFVLYTQ